MARLRIYNKKLVDFGLNNYKTVRGLYRTGGAPALRSFGASKVKGVARAARGFKWTKKRIFIAGAAAAAGSTIAYGMTSRTGKPSRSRAVRGYRRMAHISSRVVVVPAHAAYGGVKGYLNEGNLFGGIRMGIRRGLKSAEGYNPITGRKNTYNAKRYRSTRYDNQRQFKKTERDLGRDLSPQERARIARQAARKRRRNARGQFA